MTISHFKSKFARWHLPEFLCKFYLFVDFATKGVHAFLLVFGSLFLYFWFRKQESYATEAGDIHTRWADIMNIVSSKRLLWYSVTFCV